MVVLSKCGQSLVGVGEGRDVGTGVGEGRDLGAGVRLGVRLDTGGAARPSDFWASSLIKTFSKSVSCPDPVPLPPIVPLDAPPACGVPRANCAGRVPSAGDVPLPPGNAPPDEGGAPGVTCGPAPLWPGPNPAPRPLSCAQVDKSSCVRCMPAMALVCAGVKCASM